MPESPDQQWRRLTAHYAEMWDDELLNIAADYNDLTDMAKQVLRDEMRKRNLGDPSSPAPKRPEPPPSTFAARPAPPLSPTASKPIPKEPARPMGAREEREWQRCKEHYGALPDEDLEDLVGAYDDLTPVAQQVLREEMIRRNLGDPEAGITASDEESTEDGTYDAANPLLAAAELEAQHAQAHNKWWVSVFETDDRELARQYAIALSEAGILCRGNAPQSGGYVLEVAADQADEAQRVLAQPVPQSVIDESKDETSEFEMPHCERCRNQEPTLIATEPSNHWRCESCGYEWTDPIPETQQP